MGKTKTRKAKPVTLPDGVREARPEQRQHLARLVEIADKLDEHEQAIENLRAERYEVWELLADETPAVSWADLGRVSRKAPTWILQKVRGR